MTGATAARRMPGMRLTRKVAPVKMAPVLPADRKASPSPAISRFMPTVREESFFRRQAVEGLSQISMTWVALWMVRPSGRLVTPSLARVWRMTSSCPTRITWHP